MRMPPSYVAPRTIDASPRICPVQPESAVALRAPSCGAGLTPVPGEPCCRASRRGDLSTPRTWPWMRAKVAAAAGGARCSPSSASQTESAMVSSQASPAAHRASREVPASATRQSRERALMCTERACVTHIPGLPGAGACSYPRPLVRESRPAPACSGSGWGSRGEARSCRQRKRARHRSAHGGVAVRRPPPHATRHRADMERGGPRRGHPRNHGHAHKDTRTGCGSQREREGCRTHLLAPPPDSKLASI
mmetsp:Transcript_8367/g.23017  ORF Transcript_8367/g.23017 Transcript_8367/m.23017 type:complete len:250 (+) Transcript_8367:995-1744(+)